MAAHHAVRSLPRLALAASALLGLATASAAPAQQAQGGLTRTADCNGNGVADVLDISSGTSVDCQGDGIPDECQLALPYRYQFDDGAMDGSVGTVPRHVAWLSAHTVKAGHETIREIELAWGFMPTGTAARLALWSDPNGDGDPTDAQLLMEHEAYAVFPQTGVIVSEDIPDTFVGPQGSSFFVGAYGEFDPAPTMYPAALDDDSTDLVSWWISSDTPIDPNNLSSGAIFEYGLIGQYCPCDGDWVIRPVACRTGHCGESTDLNDNGLADDCEDCDGNGIPDDLDLAAGVGTDCDGNGVPDLCEHPDCDANGLADLCQALAPSGLAGAYYANRDLAGAPLGRIDAAIDFDFDLDPPFPGQFPQNDWSARWTGALVTGQAGTYEFGLQHTMGVRLWLNGLLVIDDWQDGSGYDTGSVALPGGTQVYLRLEYFTESGASDLRLDWRPPGSTGLVPVPGSALRPMLDLIADGIPDPCQYPDCDGNGVDDALDIALGTALDCDGNGVPDSCQVGEDCDLNGLLDTCELLAGSGLVARYYESLGGAGNFSNLLLLQIDPNIDFDWAGSAPWPGVPANEFAVRWSGALTTPAVGGTYRFHIQSDDGVRFWLDGELLVDEWHPSSGSVYEVDVPLGANTSHVFQLDYYEGGGDARIFARWTVPGGAEVPIPPSAFSASSDVNGDGHPDICDRDCDGDGLSDLFELATGTAVDANGDGLPDDCAAGTGHWRFEEAGGATILDAAGNGLVGSLSPLPTRERGVPTPDLPVLGVDNLRTLDLNWQDASNGGYAEVPDPAGLLSAGGEDFTLEAWVRLDMTSNTGSSNQRQWLFQKKPPAASDALLDYGLLVQAGNLTGNGKELVFRYGDGTAVLDLWSSLRIEDTQWHFVSLAYDSIRQELRFGLDGAYETRPFVKPDLGSTDPLLIGAHENQSAQRNQFLRGRIDEVRFTRAALPPELLLDAGL